MADVLEKAVRSNEDEADALAQERDAARVETEEVSGDCEDCNIYGVTSICIRMWVRSCVGVDMIKYCAVSCWACILSTN